MAFANGGFKSWATSLLRPSRPASSQSHDEKQKAELSPIAEELTREKVSLDEPDKSIPRSSAEKESDLRGDLAVADDVDPNRIVPWVRSFTEDDENLGPTSQLISHSPPNAQVAQHNSSPSSKPARGKLYDHQREWAPPIPSALVNEHASRWRAFVKASAYPAVTPNGGERVTEEWLVENGADYSRPWLAGSETEDAENNGSRLFKFQARRKSWWDRLQRTILRSPAIPLVIRTNVWVFSLIALVLGTAIYRNIECEDKQAQEPSSPDPSPPNPSSPTMAIAVDAIALLYILYITYDEYTGKPLGLRSPRAKMRLIFLDLFFIVFDSANLSLAFEAVRDSEKCGPRYRRQTALASVLLIALISWLLTFSISVFRLVERVTRK